MNRPRISINAAGRATVTAILPSTRRRSAVYTGPSEAKAIAWLQSRGVDPAKVTINKPEGV